jgi:hypothetical protein
MPSCVLHALLAAPLQVYVRYVPGMVLMISVSLILLCASDNSGKFASYCPARTKACYCSKEVSFGVYELVNQEQAEEESKCKVCKVVFEQSAEFKEFLTAHIGNRSGCDCTGTVCEQCWMSCLSFEGNFCFVHTFSRPSRKRGLCRFRWFCTKRAQVLPIRSLFDQCFRTAKYVCFNWIVTHPRCSSRWSNCTCSCHRTCRWSW